MVFTVFAVWRCLDAHEVPFIAVEADDAGDELVELGTGEFPQPGSKLVAIVGFLRRSGQNVSEGEAQHGQVDLLMLPRFLDGFVRGGGIVVVIGRTERVIALARRGVGRERATLAMPRMGGMGLPDIVVIFRDPFGSGDSGHR